MKILLLGANGQLGQCLRASLGQLGELLLASRDGRLQASAQGHAVDLARPDSLPFILDTLRPQIIVNAAAYTAVDQAEQDEPLASRVNGESVGMLGQWAARNGALVAHYSTDYVFDGRGARPYREEDATAPLNAYGRSKLLGELLLQRSGAEYMVFRTAWVYAAQGKNFLRTMLRLAAERDELRVVADQFGTPTHAGLLARMTAAALNKWLIGDQGERRKLLGVWHATAAGQASWHDFASTIVNLAVSEQILRRAPKVTSITTADFPTPAPRPPYSVLDTARFSRTFGLAIPEWQAGVREVMAELKHSL